MSLERRYLISISPPLLNSSNPWATTLSDLRALYNCPFTGAVTTRTSLPSGFLQHPTTHQYTFFSASTGHATSRIDTGGEEGRGECLPGETSSLNNLGYSPIPFRSYIAMVVLMSQNGELNRKSVKPFIISVAGTAKEVGECYSHLLAVQDDPDGMYPHSEGSKSSGLGLMMEINLSCPNIPNKPPPAYDGAALLEYINCISSALRRRGPTGMTSPPVAVGIKTPPYTYEAQFRTLLTAFEESAEEPGGCPIAFVTATNTLGSCLVLDGSDEAALGSGIGNGFGGMAGDAIHPIALGNVRTIRNMLDGSVHPELQQIAILGVGGVRDAAGFRRMRKVGASAVEVGTALGRSGIEIFAEISEGDGLGTSQSLYNG